MSAAAAPPVRLGRHRSKAAGDAILAATLELLSERGYDGFTVSSVIERAGVSSATLYRRWPTKQHLVVAAVASLAPQPIDSDTGSLAGDLRALLAHIAQSVAARREDVAEALAHEVKRNAELAAALGDKFLLPRLDELRGILARARQRGELGTAPSPEIALSLAAGPLYHRAFVLGETLTPAFVAQATRHALRGLGAVTPPDSPRA